MKKLFLLLLLPFTTCIALTVVLPLKALSEELSLSQVYANHFLNLSRMFNRN